MIDFQSDFRFLALPSVISHIPNKRRAWNDIIRLTGDKSEYIRKKANRYTLIFIFPDVPDKKRSGLISWASLQKGMGIFGTWQSIRLSLFFPIWITKIQSGRNLSNLHRVRMNIS